MSADEHAACDADVDAELRALVDADGLPRSGSRLYTEKRYWDWRARQDAPSVAEHEWLASYDAVKDIVRAHVPRAARVLLVGCGTSAASADMADDGFSDITSTDYSAPTIDLMRRKYGASHPGIVWEVQDMLALSYPAQSFDCVFDKAAMDAVLADGGDAWTPPAHLLEAGERITAETWRVLKPGGVYLMLTFSQPHFRKQYLLQDASRWERVAVERVHVGFGYIMLILHKPAEPAPST